MKAKRKYTNGEITVFWRPDECIHSSICFTRLRSVFNPSNRPWVNMEGGTTQEIISVVNACPTRALTFMWNDEKKNAEETSGKLARDLETGNCEFAGEANEKADVEVKIMRNGPIVISGNFKMYDSSGCVMKPVKMTSLCRCGFSNNLPFCDGSHFKHQFRDDED